MDNALLDTEEALVQVDDDPHLPPVTRRRNALQNLGLARQIEQGMALCYTLEHDTEIAALLRPRGVNPSSLTYGKSLVQRAQSAFLLRQQAMGAEDDAVREANRLFLQVHAEHIDFRTVVRTCSMTQGARTRLGLDKPLAKDRFGFVAQVRASYSAANQPGFQAMLNNCGFGETVVSGLLGDVAELEVALVRSQGAQAAATRATVERNAAVDELAAWGKTVRTIARSTLRDRPDLLQKLGV